LGFWGEFSGGITKIEICRLAAYLNHGVQRIAEKTGSLMPAFGDKWKRKT
jgi:hypothetical protein